jgi:hypothetical protein
MRTIRDGVKGRFAIECDSGTRVRQINGPNVVQGHSMQKLMNTQRQAFELSSRNMWHDRHSLSDSFGLSRIFDGGCGRADSAARGPAESERHL